MPQSKKESDATQEALDRASKFQWEEDDYFIVSQPEEEETVTGEEEPKPPKGSPIVIDPGSTLDKAVQKQIAENKKAGKWGVGTSPLDKLHGG